MDFDTELYLKIKKEHKLGFRKTLVINIIAVAICVILFVLTIVNVKSSIIYTDFYNIELSNVEWKCVHSNNEKDNVYLDSYTHTINKKQYELSVDTILNNSNSYIELINNKLEKYNLSEINNEAINVSDTTYEYIDSKNNINIKVIVGKNSTLVIVVRSVGKYKISKNVIKTYESIKCNGL